MAIYSDIDIELSRQKDGDVTVDIDIEAVKNSIINIILTIPGSRRMLPTFASGPYSLLFEPMCDETSQKIGGNIVDAINRWDDRVEIKQLHIIANYDRNIYEGILTFSIRNITPEISYNIDFILKAL
jgi:phage baseplate assembly protein W